MNPLVVLAFAGSWAVTPEKDLAPAHLPGVHAFSQQEALADLRTRRNQFLERDDIQSAKPVAEAIVLRSRREQPRSLDFANDLYILGRILLRSPFADAKGSDACLAECAPLFVALRNQKFASVVFYRAQICVETRGSTEAIAIARDGFRACRRMFRSDVPEVVELGLLYAQLLFNDSCWRELHDELRNYTAILGRTDSKRTGLFESTLGAAEYELGNWADYELLKRSAARRLRRVAMEDPNPVTREQELRAISDEAAVDQLLGRFDRASSLHLEALEKATSLYTESDGEWPTYAINVANIYRDLGRFDEAEVMLARARRVMAEDSYYALDAIKNLGAIYLDEGRYEDAIELLEGIEALQAEKKIYDEAELASVASNLGECYRALGLPKRSADAFARSASRYGDDPSVANLRAWAILNQGSSESLISEQETVATTRIQEGWALLQKALPADHPDLANAASLLAEQYLSSGNTDGALTLLRGAAVIQEKALPRTHPAYLDTLSLIAEAERQKRESGAIERFRKVIRARRSGLMTLALNAPDAVLFGAAARAGHDYAAVPNWVSDPARADDAYGLVLRLRGLAADVSMRRRQLRKQLATDPSTTAVAEQLNEDSNRLQKLTTEPPPSADPATLASLRERYRTSAERAERTLVRKLNLDAMPEPDLASIKKSLGSDQALIEWARYEQSQGTREDRYGAFVVRADKPVAFVDVGSATSIDAKIGECRSAILETSNEAQARLGDLTQVLIAPLLPALRGANTWRIAADGAIHAVPFDALVDRGVSLGRSRVITYLNSGVDLLQSASDLSQQPPAVFADAVFGEPDTTPWRELPGTRLEGESIAKLLGVELVSGTAVTRKALEGLNRPRLLHIATHGYFRARVRTDLGDTPTPQKLSFVMYGANAKPEPMPLLERLRNAPDPMLNSGLALAGANDDEKGDCYLTAAQLANLSLSGTRLVVLSACDSGLADSMSGQGLFGLRRAAFAAGAAGTIVSLWKVDDQAGALLMRRFYGSLKRGASAPDSLRQAKNWLSNQPKYRHPYYWAGFVYCGKEI